ncbi:MAG TPA: kelch repeat-containing protein, partial [Candidatus Paceibacterota bacterium]
MADGQPQIDLFDWSGGLMNRRKNPLAYPENGFEAGENFDVQDGALHTRPGSSISSSADYPLAAAQVLPNDSLIPLPGGGADYTVGLIDWNRNESSASAEAVIKNVTLTSGVTTVCDVSLLTDFTESTGHLVPSGGNFGNPAIHFDGGHWTSYLGLSVNPFRFANGTGWPTGMNLSDPWEAGFSIKFNSQENATSWFTGAVLSFPRMEVVVQYKKVDGVHKLRLGIALLQAEHIVAMPPYYSYTDGSITGADVYWFETITFNTGQFYAFTAGWDGTNFYAEYDGVAKLPLTNTSSTGSASPLPAGEIKAMAQVRFPTNEVSYLVAQVESVRDPVAFEAQDSAPASSGCGIVWDEGNGVALLLGTTLTDLYEFDPDAATQWTTLTAPTGGPPLARSVTTAQYIPFLESVIIFGGFIGPATNFNDTWVLDRTDNTWTEWSCSGDIPTAGIYQSVFRSATNTLIVWQGADFLYELNLATKVWTSHATTKSGAGLFPDDNNIAMAAAYIASTDNIIIAGGTASGEIEVGTTWILNFSTYVWTQRADMLNVQVNQAGYKGFYCSGMFYVIGSLNDVSFPLGVYRFTVATNTWTQLTSLGTAPAGGMPWAGCMTDLGSIFLLIGSDIYLTETYCTTTAGLTDGAIYASPTHLPTASGAFTNIYDLGPGAGVCTFGQLNDRVVITEGVVDRPLVWAGAMENDASDWPHPLHVLVSQDGNTYYDISSDVCDKDSDTIATVENIRMGGHIDICLDMPLVEAIHITMETPNTGLPVESQVFTQTTTFDTASEVSRQDLKAGIIQWYKDGAGVGHFEGAEIDIDAAAAVNKGGGLVGIPATGHGITSPTGKRIRLEGTINYNGIEVLDATTSANELVITAPYVAETFNVGTEKVRHCLTLGAGKDCPDVVPGMSVDFAGTEVAIVSQTGDGDAGSSVTLESDHATASVTAIYGLVIDGSTLTVESVASGSMADSFTKTLDGNPFIAPMTLNLR